MSGTMVATLAAVLHIVRRTQKCRARKQLDPMPTDDPVHAIARALTEMVWEVVVANRSPSTALPLLQEDGLF